VKVNCEETLAEVSNEGIYLLGDNGTLGSLARIGKASNPKRMIKVMVNSEIGPNFDITSSPYVGSDPQRR